MPAETRSRPRISGQTTALLLLLTILVAPSWAAEMSETVLPNGLRVVLRRVEGNPVVCSAVLVRAGVAWEPEEMSGASHFLEHLLFNGTKKRTQEQLYADVDAMGAYNNATTRADHTLFLLLAPSRHLERALEIQADMLLHSILPADKFSKEKGIVLEEMGRDAGDPAHQAELFFTRHLFAGSPYARPVLGTVASIQGLTRDAVKAYYQDRYTPRRMVLFLAGEFDPEQALQVIRRQFRTADGDAGPVEPDASLPATTIHFAARPQAAHQHLEAGRTYLRAAFPAPPAGDPDEPAYRLMAQALASRSTSLYAALKGGDQPAVYDYTLDYNTTGGTGSLTLQASLTDALPTEQVVRKAAMAMRDSLAPGAMDQADLEMLHEEQLTADATLEEQVHYYAMFRAPRLLAASSAEIVRADAFRGEVDVARFSLLAQRYLDPLRAVVTVSGPGETDGATSAMDLAGDKGMPAEGSAMAEAGATAAGTHILDNGLTLSIQATTGTDVFAIHLLARNRSALEPANRAGLADLVHRLLLLGTMASSAENLDEKLRSLGITTKFFDDPRFPFDDYRTTPLYSYAIMETRTENGVAAMRLFAEILQTPRFAPADITSTVEFMQDLSRRRTESSMAISESNFFNLVAQDDALARPVSGTPESLAGITRQEIMAMHQRLMAPANLILSIRGGETVSLLRRARDLFGGSGPAGGFSLEEMPPENSATPTALLVPVDPRTEPRRHEETLGKQQSYMRMGTLLQSAQEDHVALAVAVLALSDRLQTDLREGQGLAYSVGAALSPLGGPYHLLLIFMGTAAENLEHGESEIRRIAGELVRNPVDAEEIQHIVAAHTGRILMRRLTSQNQAMYDGLQILYGVFTSGNLDFLAAMGAVTPGEVAAAARRYIQPDQWSLAVVR